MKRVFSFARILLLSAALLCVAQLASAQDESDFDINTPAIILLQKSMANRFLQLRPLLEAGAVGLTHDGLIAKRDAASIDPKSLLALDSLIEEENRDRATLYREIARANGRPEWESSLRSTFGKRWIARMPVGWFYRSVGGLWVKK